MEVGDRVTWREPQDEKEESARYVVLEDRGNRVLMEYECSLPIPPTEVTLKADLKTVPKA